MYVCRRRAFIFLRPLMPRGTGCSGRLMPAGHLLFCATKKVSKKVAGNAIPRSRLPSERKIAHSRVGSLYPYVGYKVRPRKKYLFNRTVSMDASRENRRFSRYRRAFRPRVSSIGRYGPYRCQPRTRRQIRNRGPAPRPEYVQAVRASVPPRPPAIRPEPFRSPPSPCSPPPPTHSPTSTPPASG